MHHLYIIALFVTNLSLMYERHVDSSSVNFVLSSSLHLSIYDLIKRICFVLSILRLCLSKSLSLSVPTISLFISALLLCLLLLCILLQIEFAKLFGSFYFTYSINIKLVSIQSCIFSNVLVFFL